MLIKDNFLHGIDACDWLPQLYQSPDFIHFTSKTVLQMIVTFYVKRLHLDSGEHT